MNLITAVLANICLILLLSVSFSLSQKRQLRKEYAKTEELQDAEHIKEHLKEEVDVSNMTMRQRHFHYFRMYDYDKNYRIDGLEIIKAITHDDHHDDDPLTDDEKTRTMSDEELERTVDEILEKADINMDGYVVFPEYIKYLVPAAVDDPSGQAQKPPSA